MPRIAGQHFRHFIAVDEVPFEVVEINAVGRAFENDLEDLVRTFELLLGLMALRGIHELHDGFGVFVRVLDQLRRAFDESPLPAFPDERELIARGGVASELPAFMIILHQGETLGGDELKEIEADDLVQRMSRELGGRFVHVGDPKVGVQDHDGQEGVSGDREEPLLALPRRLEPGLQADGFFAHLCIFRFPIPVRPPYPFVPNRFPIRLSS